MRNNGNEKVQKGKYIYNIYNEDKKKKAPREKGYKYTKENKTKPNSNLF